MKNASWLLIFLLLVSLTACATGSPSSPSIALSETPQPSQAIKGTETWTPWPTPSLSAPQSLSSPTASPALSGTPTTYETKVFQPAFTVQPPPGWMVAERGPGAAQIYQPCKTCAHEGEENGEITLDMALVDSSLAEAIARLQVAKNIDPGPTEPAELGALSGFKFTATRTGNGEVRFQDSGYGSEAAGLPLEVYVFTVAGKTVTIFIDPHESSGDAALAFMETALAIMKAIYFTG